MSSQREREREREREKKAMERGALRRKRQADLCGENAPNSRITQRLKSRLLEPKAVFQTPLELHCSGSKLEQLCSRAAYGEKERGGGFFDKNPLIKLALSPLSKRQNKASSNKRARDSTPTLNKRKERT